MEKKSLIEKADLVGTRFNTLCGVIAGASVPLLYIYFVLNPSVVATGERFPIELPQYRYYKPVSEEERKQKGFDWENESFFDTPNYRESWHVTIENKGKTPLKDLKVEMPVEGVYKLEDGEVRPFDKEIKLEPLSGYNKIKVKVWTTHPPIGDTPKDYRVSHDEGAEVISFPLKATPLDRWVLYIAKTVVWLFFMLVGGWYLGQFIARWIVRSSDRKAQLRSEGTV